jgi:Na+-driven multidrug efflux pump
VVLWARLSRACGEACSTAERHRFLPGLPQPTLDDCKQTLQAGSWLTARTLAAVGVMSYSSVAASLLGTVAGAAHQILFQIWLAASLLADAVAIAGQSLLATAIARAESSRVAVILRRTASLGLALGVATACLLAAWGRQLLSVFSTDPGVLAAAALAWPFVVATQPLNTLAFVVDGMLFGASDFAFCAILMTASAMPAFGLMYLGARQGSLPGLITLWAGLGVFMAMRTVLGAARITYARGPWRLLVNKKRG